MLEQSNFLAFLYEKITLAGLLREFTGVLRARESALTSGKGDPIYRFWQGGTGKRNEIRRESDNMEEAENIFTCTER